MFLRGALQPGLLYHWLLLGRPPDGRDDRLASLDCTISFGRRWLFSQMLSRDRLPLDGAVTVLQQLIELRGEKYTFCVDLLRNKRATLYTKAYGREIFVAEAETDSYGLMAFCGGLPDLDYYIREKPVKCSFPNGCQNWVSPGNV